MELLVILLVLLAATRICGEIAVRLQQPPLVGELISGILIGMLIHYFPDLFPALVGLEDDEVFHAITELGVFFLMLLAGIEMQPRELSKTSGSSLVVAVGGLLLPFALGCGLAWWLLPDSGFRLVQTVFLGTALAITAVPVAVKILIDLNALESQVGQTIVAAAIMDDILSLILLSGLTVLVHTGELLSVSDLGLLLGQIVLFFAVTSVIGIYVLPRLEPLVRKWLDEEIEFSMLVLVALAFGVLAELMQMHFIIGAFVAGLFFSARHMSEELFEGTKGKVSGLTKGFLAPIFFASIGLHLDVNSLVAVPMFVTGLILIAIAGKLVGAGLPARLTGMSTRESLTVGTAMSARGAVELIIAEIALEAGVFSRPEPPPPIVRHMYSAVVFMAIATTLLTPIAMRLLLRGTGDHGKSELAD